MFVATILGGGCDYFYQIIMGRQLGPAGYSELNALLSIFYIISVPTQTIAAFMVRFVSKYKADNKESVIAWLVRKTLLISLIAGILMSIGILIAIPSITRFISLSSSVPLFMLMLGTIIVMMSPTGYGTVQGLQRFHLSALCGISGPLTKLGFGIILVIAGFGINGAFGGAIIGTFFTFLVGMIAIRDYFTKPASLTEKPDLSNVERYLFKAIIAVVCFSILINIDVFVARQYLGPHDAGLYTVASILSKVIWFMPGAVSTVMFPRVSEYYTKNKDTTTVMRKSIFYTLLMTGIVAALYVIAPAQIINLLYGGAYIDAAPALSILGIAMTLFGLSSLFMNYGLAIENPVYVAIFSFFTALQIILIIMFHSSMIAIALDLLVTSIGIFSFSWIYLEIKSKEMKMKK
jgi:O-antigen/teichoic acid export membrane protein